MSNKELMDSEVPAGFGPGEADPALDDLEADHDHSHEVEPRLRD